MDRLTGFASGLDINQMVRDLMNAERQPLIKIQQAKFETEFKVAEYRSVNRQFQQFRESTFDGIMRGANMLAKSVTSTNESAITATAGSAAPAGSYTISDVTLAEAATSFSNGELGDEVNAAGAISEWATSGVGADGSIEFSMTTFNANGEAVTEDFSFSENDSLNTVLTAINNSDLGVQAFFDPFSNRVSMQRTETGEFNPNGNGEIIFGSLDDDGIPVESDFLTEALNLDSAQDQGARNATFTINGLATERTSNTFSVNGMQVTLNENIEGPVRLSVDNNVDRAFDTIMAFVDEYNEMIGGLNDKVSEEYFRDFPPLTDEQRSELSESEIEKWEEKSNSGLLRNDSIINGALNNMRQDVYTPVAGDGTFTQITQIGITTTSNFQDRGRLEVNEDELRAALAEDPEAVFALFAGDGATPAEQGIARRLRNTLQGSITDIGNRAGRSDSATPQTYTLGRELLQTDDRISNFERRLQQIENRYWAQFTAMERAISQSNAQAESLFASLMGPQQ
ncbi:flagellar hook-associated protein 2 [Paenalkalicoccus suaedae]|uniref:Flagellar hook-associated protein 2 n=1 Tax=Paenalkalicoccus suaedae TaxID=2592382 RepID=A0A859FGZ0_9BACI|nr:flagellar hook-associated protein 2 [Paenalkalicoccus suaedae]QKS72311.1 flagellar hook-associated protein 2 [Paenalkalicoccus suaedae]